MPRDVGFTDLGASHDSSVSARSDMADSLASPTSPATSTSSASSLGTNQAHVSSGGGATSKHGRAANSGAAQSWGRWLADKYTVQYAIPAAYAPATLQVCITAFPLGVLFGLVLPHTFRFLAGADEGLAWYVQPQLALYLCSWAVFHMLEFTVTASFNPTRLFSDSFLLNNGVHYHLAHLVALLEFALTAHVTRGGKRMGWVSWVGLATVVVGQVLRSLAMVQAHNNFSHVVADRKRQDHQLVTTGVYAWTRHPSYVGFFYWAVGTQLLLGNKLALAGFVTTLWYFFSRRVYAEEKYLVEFFGDDYLDYRKRTGTGLPFI